MVAKLKIVARMGGLTGCALQHHIDGMRPEYVEKTFRDPLVRESEANEVIEALERRIAAAESVIHLFARRADEYDEPDENGPFPDIQDALVTVGDLRLARQYLRTGK